MMKIKSIFIDGFKNLDKVSLDFEDKISILLSTNNYGKSNVLDAIEFAFMFTKSLPITRKRLSKQLELMPLSSFNYMKNFKLEVSYINEEDEKDNNEIVYSYEFKWPSQNEDTYKIIKESLKVKSNNSQKFTTYIERDLDNNLSLYKASKTGRCDKHIHIDNDDLIINKLRYKEDLFYLNIIDELVNNQTVYDYKQSDYSLASFLNKLNKESKYKFDLIIYSIKTLFSGIEDIKLVKEENDNKISFNNNYKLLIKTKYFNSYVSLPTMSDGFKRILSMLVFIVNSDLDKANLICIEEPENSIHPGLLKVFLNLINQLIDNSKLILTSHSPYLINNVNLKNIYIGYPHLDNQCIFKKLTYSSIRKIKSILEEEYMNQGEYLFSLIHGEIEEDREELKRMLEF